MTERIALVIEKSLSPGAAANVAAILMGQLARLGDAVYAPPVRDGDGLDHAGIRHSTVVLKAGAGQLRNLAIGVASTDLTSAVFSSIGQSLNNAFDEYASVLREASEAPLVGVGIYGCDADVRQATKKFSVLA